jgi:hypothetical protein
MSLWKYSILVEVVLFLDIYSRKDPGSPFFELFSVFLPVVILNIFYFGYHVILKREKSIPYVYLLILNIVLALIIIIYLLHSLLGAPMKPGLV